ncbi:AroM family protein [Erwinia sp. CGal63]|uniref:AroM family protein n=1 Tax=Erwinia sp. CGal63 TaxID=2919889 RepID=UPI003FA60C8B
MTDILTKSHPSAEQPTFSGAELLFSESLMADMLGEAESNANKLATLTLGKAPRRDLLPLLLEHLPEENIAHFGLLDGLSSAEIEQRYGPVAGEKVTMTHMEDGSYVILSAGKVEAELQKLIFRLEAKGFANILILCAGEYKNLKANSAILLEPYRMLPPLVNAITDGHQVGVMVAREEYLGEQAYKWQSLASRPRFAVASPWVENDDELIDAALHLQEQGADVVVLDCLGYHQRHRDFLQKLLGIPVLLSNVLLAGLAAELVA